MYVIILMNIFSGEDYQVKSILNKFEKYFKKIKRDGFNNATKKAWVKIKNEYLSSFDIKRISLFKKKKDSIIKSLDKILYNTDYDRIIVWRSSIGYTIPLFQRPQHLVNMFAKNKCLVFFEVTKLTDKTDFIDKLDDNLYLVNYDIKGFAKLFNQKLRMIRKPKYLFTASTCWDLSEKVVMSYVKNGFKFIYDYLDELSPALAGTDKLPYNVSVIHNYVINNIESCYVICTADRLYEDMVKKRGSNKNIVFACNGVRLEHFKNLNKKVNLSKDFLKIVGEKKPIIGYYGALATWFDYDLICELAEKRKNYNIVLIGSKYDTSIDNSNISNYKNIHFIGPKKYEELPYYATHFDVATLPFLLNDITASTSPIKVFEYMALSLPIVTTDILECRKYDSINIAHSNEEFISLIDKMINITDKNYFKCLKEDAHNNTWESKAKTIISGLNTFEKNTYFLSTDDVFRDIMLKIYSQNYNTDIKTLVKNKIKRKNKLFIITINSETCMVSKDNDSYRNIVLNDEVLLVPDSISITYVMKRAFKEKIERYPGIDLLVDVFKELDLHKKTLYLYGSTTKVNKDMVKYIKTNFKNIKVVGSSDGYVKDDTVIEEEIVSLKPDSVIVALGIPRQEEFINRIYKRLDKGIMIGVGGSFDVLSGNQKRAPLFMRKINLEWLYRIAKDPKRFNRFYNNNLKFVLGKGVKHDKRNNK